MTKKTGKVKQRMWRGKPVVRFHAMAKPTGPVCNLNCEYCFYLNKKQLLHTDSRWRMSDEVLETFIRQYIEDHNYEEVIFSWQGGEPSLLGLDFFRKVVQLERKYCPPGVTIQNDLQTNGTLLDEEWCEFLRDHNFLVGLSIDGPKRLHDRYRKDAAGHGSFDRVFAASKLLRKHGVAFATLTCVNRLTGKHPLKVYRFLRDEVGSQRMQFIPIVEPRIFDKVAPQRWPAEAMPFLGDRRARPGRRDSVVHDWCVDPVDYGNFLIRMFDEWITKDLGSIYVHFFDCAVEQCMGRVAPLCVFAPICGKGLAVEHDGSVYACDHYVYPEYRLGSIMEQPLVEMALSKRQESFGYGKDHTLPGRCRECRFLWMCAGECPKNRFLVTQQGEPGLNYLCTGLKRYFEHIEPYVKAIAADLQHAPRVKA
jgi:serine-type anaerobic sulfatase-maturating enzyme